MSKTVEEMEEEYYKAWSIAINMAKINDKDLIPFMEEQRKELQDKMRRRQKIKELDAMRKSSS